MNFANTSGFSSESPAAALASALGSALRMGTDAASVTIVAESVIKTAGGWTASVRVMVEPKLPETPAAPAPLPGPAPAKHESPPHIQLQQALEEERRRHAEASFDLEQEKKSHLYRETAERLAARELATAGAPLTHLYLDTTTESIFQAIQDRFSFDYVHTGTDSMLGAVKTHHPDLDMYEAAHPQAAKPPAPEPSPASEPAVPAEGAEPAEE